MTDAANAEAAHPAANTKRRKALDAWVMAISLAVGGRRIMSLCRALANRLVRSTPAARLHRARAGGGKQATRVAPAREGAAEPSRTLRAPGRTPGTRREAPGSRAAAHGRISGRKRKARAELILCHGAGPDNLQGGNVMLRTLRTLSI